MLDDMDRGPKIAIIALVVVVVLVLAVPLVFVLAAVIATFVLGLGNEAVLLIPVAGPAFGRRVRRTVADRLPESRRVRGSAGSDWPTRAE